MSVRCLRWSLSLFCFLMVTMLCYFNISSCTVIENLNWMYLYEYKPINHSEFAFMLWERLAQSRTSPSPSSSW